jgi:hypothetical protein
VSICQETDESTHGVFSRVEIPLNLRCFKPGRFTGKGDSLSHKRIRRSVRLAESDSVRRSHQVHGRGTFPTQPKVLDSAFWRIRSRSRVPIVCLKHEDLSTAEIAERYVAGWVSTLGRIVAGWRHRLAVGDPHLDLPQQGHNSRGGTRAADVRLMTGLKIASTSSHDARFRFVSLYHAEFGSRKRSRIVVASSRRRNGFARKAAFVSRTSCSRVWLAKPDTQRTRMLA